MTYLSDLHDKWLSVRFGLCDIAFEVWEPLEQGPDGPGHRLVFCSSVSPANLC